MTLACSWKHVAPTLQFAEYLYFSIQKQTEITILCHLRENQLLFMSKHLLLLMGKKETH